MDNSSKNRKIGRQAKKRVFNGPTTKVTPTPIGSTLNRYNKVVYGSTWNLYNGIIYGSILNLYDGALSMVLP